MSVKLGNSQEWGEMTMLQRIKQHFWSCGMNWKTFSLTFLLESFFDFGCHSSSPFLILHLILSMESICLICCSLLWTRYIITVPPSTQTILPTKCSQIFAICQIKYYNPRWENFVCRVSEFLMKIGPKRCNICSGQLFWTSNCRHQMLVSMHSYFL